MDELNMTTEPKFPQSAEGIVWLKFAAADTPMGRLIQLAELRLDSDNIECKELLYEGDQMSISIILNEKHRPSHGLRVERNAVTIVMNAEEGLSEGEKYRFVALAPPTIQDWDELLERNVKSLNESYTSHSGIKFIE